MDDDDEISCPGCDELVDVRRPVGVELHVGHPASMTSVPAPCTITVGGIVVHRCEPDDAQC